MLQLGSREEKLFNRELAKARAGTKFDGSTGLPRCLTAVISDKEHYIYILNQSQSLYNYQEQDGSIHACRGGT